MPLSRGHEQGAQGIPWEQRIVVMLCDKQRPDMKHLSLQNPIDIL